jgi:hypothetical protein
MVVFEQAELPDLADRGKLRVSISYSRDDLEFADPVQDDEAASVGALDVLRPRASVPLSTCLVAHRCVKLCLLIARHAHHVNQHANARYRPQSSPARSLAT